MLFPLPCLPWSKLFQIVQETEIEISLIPLGYGLSGESNRTVIGIIAGEISN